MTSKDIVGVSLRSNGSQEEAFSSPGSEKSLPIVATTEEISEVHFSVEMKGNSKFAVSQAAKPPNDLYLMPETLEEMECDETDVLNAMYSDVVCSQDDRDFVVSESSLNAEDQSNTGEKKPNIDNENLDGFKLKVEVEENISEVKPKMQIENRIVKVEPKVEREETVCKVEPKTEVEGNDCKVELKEEIEKITPKIEPKDEMEEYLDQVEPNHTAASDRTACDLSFESTNVVNADTKHGMALEFTSYSFVKGNKHFTYSRKVRKSTPLPASISKTEVSNTNNAETSLQRKTYLLRPSTLTKTVHLEIEVSLTGTHKIRQEDENLIQSNSVPSIKRELSDDSLHLTKKARLSEINLEKGPPEHILDVGQIPWLEDSVTYVNPSIDCKLERDEVCTEKRMQTDDSVIDEATTSNSHKISECLDNTAIDKHIKYKKTVSVNCSLISPGTEFPRYLSPKLGMPKTFSLHPQVKLNDNYFISLMRKIVDPRSSIKLTPPFQGGDQKALTLSECASPRSVETTSGQSTCNVENKCVVHVPLVPRSTTFPRGVKLRLSNVFRAVKDSDFSFTTSSSTFYVEFKYHKLVIRLGPSWNEPALSAEEFLAGEPPKSFILLLRCICFSDTLIDSLDVAFSVYRLAMRLYLDKICSFCCKCICNIMTMETLGKCYSQACLWNFRELREKCSMMATTHATELFSTNYIYSFSKEALQVVLSHSKLLIPSDTILFHGIIRWARANLKARKKWRTKKAIRKELDPLLPNVRFLTMSLWEFTNSIMPTCILSEEECNIIRRSIILQSEEVPPTLPCLDVRYRFYHDFNCMTVVLSCSRLSEPGVSGGNCILELEVSKDLELGCVMVDGCVCHDGAFSLCVVEGTKNEILRPLVQHNYSFEKCQPVYLKACKRYKLLSTQEPWLNNTLYHFNEKSFGITFSGQCVSSQFKLKVWVSPRFYFT